MKTTRHENAVQTNQCNVHNALGVTQKERKTVSVQGKSIQYPILYGDKRIQNGKLF